MRTIGQFFSDLFRREPTKWSTPEVIEALDQTPIGRDLAERVADRLASGARMLNQHRDYCGHGLVLRAGRIELVENHDGRLGEVLSWPDRASFVDWLSVQCDYSLSGADDGVPALHTTDSWRLNNQRITRGWLAAFASGQG
ncbi:hypothetical protein [Rubrivirga sp. IMCC43871]|uniref:hypothetical protein n=1 Tax=Rubrivirga sp. IMCC43871 TaxID=3391575 RepID=UPI00399024A9